MRYIITDATGKIMEQGPIECAPAPERLVIIKKAGYKYRTFADTKSKT